MRLENKIKQAAKVLSQNSANITLYSTRIYDKPLKTEAVASNGSFVGLRRGVMPLEIDPEIALEIYEKNKEKELLLHLRKSPEEKLRRALALIINDNASPVEAFKREDITALQEFKRFIFVAPYHAYGKTLRVLFQPQGVENISWFLLRNTEDVDSRVYNIHLTSREEYEKFISGSKIDLMGFSPLVMDEDLEIIGKSSILSPSSIKMLGGPAIRKIPPKILFDALNVDIICYGRGEEVCKQVAESMNKGFSLNDFKVVPNIALHIKGSTIKTENKKIKINGGVNHIEDIPLEQLDAVHRTSYSNKRAQLNMTNSHKIDHVGQKRLVVEYTDHCKGNCIFCNVPKSTRKKSLDSLFEEIKEKVKTGDYDSIHFIDNTFSTYPEEVTKISKWFIDEGLKSIPKACKLRASETTSEILEQLSKAGFTRIFYGIESFDNLVLEKLQKETTKEQNESAIEKTLGFGMIPGLNLILPTPYDNKKTIETTISRSLDYVREGATLNIVPHLYVDYSTPLFYKYPEMVVYKPIFFEGMKSPYQMPFEARFHPELKRVVSAANTQVSKRIEDIEEKNQNVSIHDYSLMFISALSRGLGLSLEHDAERLISVR